VGIRREKRTEKTACHIEAKRCIEGLGTKVGEARRKLAIQPEAKIDYHSLAGGNNGNGRPHKNPRQPPVGTLKKVGKDKGFLIQRRKDGA